MRDHEIFGLRYQSNEDLQPTQQELQQFLESPQEDRGGGSRLDDLARYLRDLNAVDDFGSRAHRGLAADYTIDERKLFSVLAHSRFFNHALKLSVEQYLYQYSRLCALDLKKPRSFVRVAQDEINSLNPRRKDDQEKIAKLQAKVDQRNDDIEALEKNRIDLTIELKNIAGYVRENLVKIQKLCESSIAALVGPKLGKEVEQEMIEDVKKSIKDELRDHMLLGPVSLLYAEKMRVDFSQHSKEMSQLVFQDIYSVTHIYEQVRNHVKKCALTFDMLVQQVEAKKGVRFEEERNILGKVGEELISLILDYRFEVVKTEDVVHKDEHEGLIMDKRKELIHHLFALLQSNPAPGE